MPSKYVTRSLTRGKKKTYGNMSDAALKKKIKAVMYREVETKTIGGCTTQLFNSNDYNGFALTDIGQSTSTSRLLAEEWNKRYGQQYMYVGTRIRMDFIAQPSGGSSTIKPILVRVVVIEGTMQGQAFAPGTSDDIFTDYKSEQTNWDAIKGTPAVISYPIDTKKYKTHYDEVHTCGVADNSANGWAIDTFKIAIFPKVKINCEQTSNGSLEQDRMFFCLYWVYDPNLIAQEGDTDVKVATFWKTYFKDP